MPSTATGANGAASARSARPAKARCAVGQDSPPHRAAADTGAPTSPTRAATCSRSRSLTRARAGICPTISVNVARAQSGLSHFHRRLSHITATGSSPWGRSRTRRTTRSCTRLARVAQSGHTAASGSLLTVHTVTCPSPSRSTSTTCVPATPSSVEALSWSMVPATPRRS